jgi:hypothetical protein
LYVTGGVFSLLGQDVFSQDVVEKETSVMNKSDYGWGRGLWRHEREAIQLLSDKSSCDFQCSCCYAEFNALETIDGECPDCGFEWEFNDLLGVK